MNNKSEHPSNLGISTNKLPNQYTSDKDSSHLWPPVSDNSHVLLLIMPVLLVLSCSLRDRAVYAQYSVHALGPVKLVKRVKRKVI